MKTLKKNLSWTSTGCALALVAGTPALADDTEILLVNPNQLTRPNPNVMFIMDTSGSMTTTETTIEPYDSTQTYSGACDTDALYWTDVDIVPTCDSSNNRWFTDSAWKCAAGDLQIAGIGSYTNTLVQYRQRTIFGITLPPTWDYVDPGNNSDWVECAADSGVHGEEAIYSTVYASARFSDVGWTDKKSDEVAWGSAPRNLSYTVYDGNYLNWRATPAPVTLSRNEIMRTVTNAVLNSVNDMNVGIMRFRGGTGGTVLEAIQDLDTNRADITATVSALPAGGTTPLSETLYEAALYWTGGNVDYGDPAATDPASLVSSVTPSMYQQPTLESCAKNYNVLITDGAPVADDDGPAKVGNLPDWGSTVATPACDGSGGGMCLDDISEYLGLVDTAPGIPGVQTVTTHTIGFTIDLPILKETAEASGGTYFLADDLESLTIALLQIVADINDRTLSFSAPAVSVNTFNRTRNLNDLYLTVFSAQNSAHWPGNVKKYEIENGAIIDADGNAAVDPATGFFFDTARSLWTVGGDDGTDVTLGGAARQLPNPSLRNLYTYNGANVNLNAAVNALATSNASAFTLADFGLTGAADEPTIDEMIDWMRGVDVRDEDSNPATTIRYAMGDPLHSRPASVVYGGTQANPEVVIFSATNDGYLHAINGTTGQELWSFVPKELLDNMARLYFNPSAAYKQYGIDGDVVPVVKDVDGDGQIESADGDFVRIVFGMRRGGWNYYALDVTNKTAPKLMWIKALDSGGQSWSTPVITRVNVDTTGTNTDKAVVIVGGGYDPAHDTPDHPTVDDATGAGIHMLDLESGVTLWRAGPDAGATKRFEPGSAARPFAMNRAFATQIRVGDFNADGFADRMYAADMGGQVWRFDIVNGKQPADLVNGGVIAQLGAEGLTTTPSAAQTRRFYNSPDISIFRDPIQGKRFVSVAIGSGYRAKPFNTDAQDRFYSLRDPAVFNQLDQASYDAYDIIDNTDLVEVSGDVKAVIGPTSRGWMFTLPADEKILADSVTFDDEIFFVGFDPNAIGANICGTGQGRNFLYRVSVVNGDPIVNNLDSITPALADDARRQQLAQGGIAPTPTMLFPTENSGTCTGSACNPPPVLCVGVECQSPGFVNNPVRTLWTQDGIE